MLTELNEKLREFIRAQHVFFTATAPGTGGRINLSPKGLDCFTILDDRTVAYLDLTGSGNETAAHIRDNGRLTIMMCSFAGPPRILRMYGTGRSVQPVDEEWQTLVPHFPALPGVRQIFVLAIESVQISCGFGVPMFEYQGQRREMIEWSEKHGPDGVREYQRKNNVTSIDGLPTGLAM